MDAASLMNLGTLLVAVLGVGLVVWQLKEQRRTLRAEFGHLYVQRFWQIDDDRILAEDGDPLRHLHDRRYLRLFEDEFEVAALGLLDLPQWAVWHGVLDDERARHGVIQALENCDPDSTEFALLRRCINQRERDGARHDISRCKAG